MQILSHTPSTITVRESWKIPGSQISYILGYADSAAVFAPHIVYADGADVAVFIPHIVYADGAAELQ